MIEKELLISVEHWVGEQYQKQAPLPYHNFEHSLYVRDACVQLAQTEDCREQDIRLLSLAALFHDLGHLEGSAQHEERSVQMALAYLNNVGLDNRDWQGLINLIEATRYGSESEGLLESIIKDADLYYLGTDDYLPHSKAYRKELATVENQSYTDHDWLQLQINFLTQHQFLLDWSKRHLEPIKQNHIKQLKNEIRRTH